MSSVVTDAPPRGRNGAGFLESDRIRRLDLPQDGRLPEIAVAIESAMQNGKAADVRRPCTGFVEEPRTSTVPRRAASAFSPLAPLRVREHWTTELFGDYDPGTMLIRLWMRTAVRKEITSFGTFLSTLCHEFCHHLDFQLFKFADSWHTRGFYERTAALYHHARGTPRKRLFWASVSGRWRIDWQRTNRGG